MEKHQSKIAGAGLKAFLVLYVIFTVASQLLAAAFVIGFPLLMGYVAHDLVTGGTASLHDYSTYVTDFEYEDLKEVLKDRSIYFEEGFSQKLGFGIPFQTKIKYGSDAEEFVYAYKEGEVLCDIYDDYLYGYEFVIRNNDYVVDWIDDIKVEVKIATNNRMENFDDFTLDSCAAYKNFAYKKHEKIENAYYIKGEKDVMIFLQFDIYVPKRYWIADDERQTEIKEEIEEEVIRLLIESVEFYDDTTPSG